MSSNNCQTNIRELDKDFIDCEKYLNRVLKRRIDKPRPSTNKYKKNDNQGRAVKVFLTGPSSRPHSSSAGLKVGTVSEIPSSERVIHKEIMANNKATVEVTVKSKQKGKQRTRSLSSGRADSKGEKNNEASKQTNLVDPSRVFQKSNRSKTPPIKHLPWSEVLKENTNPKSQEIAVKVKCHDSQDPARHVKSHHGNKESVRSKPVLKSRTQTLEQHRKKYIDSLETKHVNSKETTISGESSGFSSSMDEVECVDKGVQCWMPPSSALNGDSTTTVSSSKIAEEVNVKIPDLGPGATSLMIDTFSMFNPVRTLNFLIKELHGFVKKTNDKNLRRIIMDMEKALLRIPPDQHGGDFPLNFIPCPVSDPDTMKTSETTGHTLKHAVPLTTESFARTLASVPALALRVDSSLLSNFDNRSGKTSVSLGAAVHSDNSAVVFQKQLEESCMKLETMCQEMETNNTELRNQRDKLEEYCEHFSRELKLKNQELDAWLAKERDYMQTISTLRTNLESSGRAMAELTSLTAQLREENKSLSSVREMQYKMNQQLQESQRTNEQLQKEIQLLQLEKEKLVIINQGKDNELERFKKEVKDIRVLVVEQLTSLKTSIQQDMPESFSSLSFLTSNFTDIDSIPSDAPHVITSRRPVCSSPNSSKSSFANVNSSWEMLSSIPPLNCDHSAPAILLLSAVKEKESFKSLEVDSAEITEVSDQDDSGSNEHTVVAQTKQTGEDKNELELLFDEVGKQTKLSSTIISVLSPPHQFSLKEPEGISQYNESQLNSPLHSAILSVNKAES
ncbi:myosin-11 isoform X2 [Anabrus simplex]|uniref:myosin-11 isoform X2 n=1 Tax=Anabrus simplex TaxID=316456 RepID=UPI0035A2719A